MSSKKPGPLEPVPVRATCPVCGKASYSSTGMHPQCAVARGDAEHRAALKASLATAQVEMPVKQPVKEWRSWYSQSKTIHLHDPDVQVPSDAQPTTVSHTDGLIQGPTLGVMTMNSKNVPDRTITQQVRNKLTGRGLAAPCHVSVATQNGDVTLSGTVQFAHQKGMAVRLVSVISGVRRVVDRLTVKAAVKY